MVKSCPKCLQKHIQKFGIQNGRQRYKCMDCLYIFRSLRRKKQGVGSDKNIFELYSVRKQTLSEISEEIGVSKRTIHRRISNILASKQENISLLKVRDAIDSYNPSVLILDATFFGKKGSDTQWGLLVAQDGITKNILATKYITQERVEDYRILLRAMKQSGYMNPLFAVVDGRNGVERVINEFYPLSVQICQTHKIATIHRYLLKYPRLESYRELKRIARDMTRTDKATLTWMLEEFRMKYDKDF